MFFCLLALKNVNSGKVIKPTPSVNSLSFPLKKAREVPAHLLSRYSSSLFGGSDCPVEKITEKIEMDVQALRDLTKVNNIKSFTNRLYNSQGACFDILNSLLLKHFGPAERGVYKT